MVPTINFIYSPGKKDRVIQDAWFTNPYSIIGAVDCHSGAGEPSFPGEKIQEIVLESLSKKYSRIETGVLATNRAIGTLQGNISIKHRAGAVFALGRIEHSDLEIIHGGDTSAAWRTNKRIISSTLNQYKLFDGQAVENFARLKKKHEEREDQIWPEHRQFLAEIRENHANKRGGYANLNGDPNIVNSWWRRKIPIKSLLEIIFFTDGLLAGMEEYSQNFVDFLERIFSMIEGGGLEKLISWVRFIQSTTLENTHDPCPEICVVRATF